jgi:hypothetical protein
MNPKSDLADDARIILKHPIIFLQEMQNFGPKSDVVYHHAEAIPRSSPRQEGLSLHNNPEINSTLMIPGRSVRPS